MSPPNKHPAGSDWLDRLKTLFPAGDDTPSWHERDPNEPLTDQDRFVVDCLPFERVEVAGEEAWGVWQQMRGQQLRGGPGYPVIVGGDDMLMRTAEHLAADAHVPDEIIAASRTLVLPDAYDQFRRDRDARIQAILGDLPSGDDDEHDDPTSGVTAADVPDPDEIEVPDQDGPAALLDVLSHAPLDRAYLLRVPAAAGWEVPAHLRFGGWNDCPPAAVHVAALRDWGERYGAELVTMAGDIVELRVARRPGTRTEALALAREHLAYCSDVVERDSEQLALYAASLMVADWWYFWWD